MAHLIERMAYVGDTPWHALGQQLQPHQPIEVWAREAGMDWRICETPVRYASTGTDASETLQTFAEHKVLYRSDTQAPLSVVSQRYQVVQPQAVLEFYRDLTESSGYQLETAGVLKAGRKFWALARTGQHTDLPGSDRVNGYLLLATSCDGTLATTATPTSVRVVCNNTLSIALDGASGAIKVPHNTQFDAQAVKRQLGVAVAQWDSFMYRMKALAQRPVSHAHAQDYLRQVLCPPTATFNSSTSTLSNSSGSHASTESKAQSAQTAQRALNTVQALYDGHGRGAELSAAKGTAWGLLCAVTEFVDHERRARSHAYRLDSAWFGPGAALKQRALNHALALLD